MSAALRPWRFDLTLHITPGRSHCVSHNGLRQQETPALVAEEHHYNLPQSDCLHDAPGGAGEAEVLQLWSIVRSRTTPHFQVCCNQGPETTFQASCLCTPSEHLLSGPSNLNAGEISERLHLHTLFFWGTNTFCGSTS